jgi:PAS domain S-box-containing protein
MVAGLLVALLIVIVEGFRKFSTNRMYADVLRASVFIWAAITAFFLVFSARLFLTHKRRRRLADDFFQIEQARLLSESMFSAAFRLSPDAMAINAVPGGQFLEVNDAFTRMVGYTREEIVGKTALEMNLWVDPQHRARVMAKLQEGMEVRDEEIYCRTKSGETRIFLFSGKVIEQGGRPLSLTLGRDITARKKIEDALQASEERFRNLIQDLHVGILLLGPATEAIFANQAALDMFGLKWEQAMGNNISQVFTPIREDGTNLPQSMLPGVQAIETRRTIRNQVVGWRRPESSDVLWTLIGAIPQFTDRGEITGVILSLTNVTELKKAEEALRRNEELFRTLVENLHVGIVLLGPNQEIQFANKACLTMFGMNESEILGKNPGDLGMIPVNEDGAEIPLSLRPVARAITTRQSILKESMGWRRAGSNDVLWLQGEVVPFFGENGQLERVIASFSDMTKRKEAEEALRASEERFRGLIEATHVGIILLGPDRETKYVNQAALDLFGVTLEQALGDRISLYFTPILEDGTKIQRSMLPGVRAAETRAAIRNQVVGWQRRESNEVLWTLVDAVPQFTAHGELAGAFISITNITGVKKAEEALQKSEELFRTLVQNSDVGVVLYGPNHEIQFANRASLEMFGRREDQVLGEKGIDLSLTPLTEDGKEMPLAMRAVPRVFADKRAVLNEVTGWRRAGSNEVLWLQGGAVPLFGKNGELDRVITSFVDITKRKRAEEGLRASEELFRTLVENLHVGVVLLGPNQECQYANRASSEMFGLKEKQSLGKRAIDLGLTPLYEDGTEMPASMRPVARAFTTRQAVLNWVMGWRLAGSNDVVWIQGEAVPLFGKNGDLESVIAAYSDITNRKQAEAALHQLSTRLLQLQDEERRHIGRELHDVLAQSVMAVNLDLAQVARSSVPLDKQAKRALAEARGMLGEMSREIRTLSYLLHPPVLDELGLASAIQEYATGFSERSGIALELDIQSGFGRLPQDAETALFRIVQESLSNIQRHSGSRSARIRLRAHGHSVELQVSDRGRGMDQMKVERGSGAETRLGVGILGMRERMAQLKGKLEVESTPSGTTVRATIPLTIEVSNATTHPRGG